MAPSLKILLLLGAFLGFVSVSAGAFGAHSLKNKLSHEMLAVFEVGCRYMMYHAIAIFISVWISTLTPSLFAPLSAWLFFSGTLIFSGSLYLLVLTGIRLFGAITPIGGVIMLAGWVCLAIACWSIERL